MPSSFRPKWELISLIRRHPYLWPIIGFLATGPSLAIFTTLNKIDGPEATRIIRHDPDACNRFENKKYRIYEATKFDYENYKHPRPRF